MEMNRIVAVIMAVLRPPPPPATTFHCCWVFTPTTLGTSLTFPITEADLKTQAVLAVHNTW